MAKIAKAAIIPFLLLSFILICFSLYAEYWRVNYQPTDSPIPYPPDYLKDDGSPYGTHGDYGWTTDDDEDGLPDWWEFMYLGSMDYDADDDVDNDGLTNGEELEEGVDPSNPDTDGDEATDGDEVEFGYNPLNDSDIPNYQPGIVVINEIITHPCQDWNDDGNPVEASRTPFNSQPWPGDGGENPPLVTQADEWIELYNKSGSPLVNLSGWFLVINDDTSTSLRIHPNRTKAVDDNYTAVYVFSGSSSYDSFDQGEYMVLGDPEGMMSNDVFIELKDIRGHLIDTVELGDDPEGDNDGNGAPDGGDLGGYSTSPETEAVFRVSGSQDSDPDEDSAPWDADVLDFARGITTICGANPSLTSASPGCVVINELITDPQQDWSDSSQGNGIPFDNVPGEGTPDREDQWIELYNSSGTVQDLTGWILTMSDGSSTTIQGLGAGNSVFSFSDSSTLSAFQPGAYLIIGDPEGELADDVHIELRDVVGTLIDSVEVGDDPQGDNPGDGAPDGTANGGKSNDVGAEAIARSPNGSDSDSDVDDFTQQAATICSSNTTLSSGNPGDVVINEVVIDPRQDWSDSYGGNATPFDTNPGTGVIDAEDQWIELYNKSASVLNLSGWTLEMTDSNPVNQTLGSGFSILRHSIGSSLTELQPGGFVLIGNPTGAMENTCFIHLKDALGNTIDNVELGDDPENDGEGDGAPEGTSTGGASTSTSDESVARIPDGQDSDPDENGQPGAADIDDFNRVESSPCAPNPYEAPPEGPELINLDTGASVKIQGVDSGDLAGSSVSAAGDVNADGIGDLLIGAYDANSYRGESYIVYGSENLSSVIELSSGADVTITGALPGDYSGYSTSSGGDVNNDDTADIVLGAQGASPDGRNEAGSCYARFGGVGLPSTFSLGSESDITISGAEAGDHAGHRLVISPDINDDDIGDLLIGSPHADADGNSDTGSVHIIYGKSDWTTPLTLDLASDADVILNSSSSYSLAGYSLSASGDINGDLLSDIIVGAPQASPGGNDGAGRIFIVYGSGSLNTEIELENDSNVVIEGSEAFAKAGYSVSVGGDVNNDGTGDILIGAPYASPSGRTWAGKAYIIYGGTLTSPIDLESQADVTISGHLSYDNFGISLTCTGDHNGDGIADMVVGAPGADNGQNADTGKVYVFYGRTDLPHTIDSNTDADVICSGVNEGDQCGSALSLSGDVNADTAPDLIIGAPGADPGDRTDAGETYIIYGTLLSTPTPTITPTTTGTPTITPTLTLTPTITPTPTVTPTPTPSNFLLNPSFEDSPELIHWNKEGTASKIGWSTETAQHESRSCKFTDPTGDYSGRGIRSSNVAVSGSAHYSFAGWFYIEEETGAIEDTKFRFRVEWRDSSGELISRYPGTTGFSLTAFSSWEQKEFINVTAPANAAYMSLLIEVKEDAVNDNDAYIDNFSFTEYIFPTPTPTSTPTPTPLPGQYGNVLINEVVACPLQEWNDETTPFDDVPGGAEADFNDEWIELYNASGTVLDMTGWKLVMIDLSVQEQEMGGGPGSTEWIFTNPQSSISSFQPGDYLVIGNPKETLSDDIYIEIRNAENELIDRVEIGSDPENDGEGDGAPDGSDRGALASHRDAEAIARSPNGTTTVNDIADFYRMSATIGSANPDPPTLPSEGDVLINEVVTDPVYDWSDTENGVGIPFDSQPGEELPDSGDQWIELYNASASPLSLAGWTLLIMDTNGQTFTEMLGVDSAYLVFSDGSSLGNLESGDYMVVGDLGNALDNKIFLELSTPAGEVIDTVEIGDDPLQDGESNCAPKGSASGGESPLDEIESVGRLPNGTDSNADEMDFNLLPSTIGAENTSLQAAATPSVVINEVVADPQKDWSDSDAGNGIPYDDQPGEAEPDSGDEWIELYNTSGSAIDLTGWTLTMSDSGPETQVLGGGDSVYVFSAGTITNFPPDAYLVIGNPLGSISNDVLLELKDGVGNLIDSVQLGEGGAPDGGSNGGIASSDAAEAVARVPNGSDSDDDINDFIAYFSSIGAENPSPPSYAEGDVLINEAVTCPQADWDDTENGDENPFNAVPGSGDINSVDEWIELYNDSVTEVNLAGWTVTMTDGTPATQSIGGGTSVYRLTSSGDLGSFLAGDYMVIGDPTEALGNSVFIELRDAWGTLIDDVEIGDDPEGDGAGDGAPGGFPEGGYSRSSGDEAVARVPNAVDSGDEVTDFSRIYTTIGSENPAVVPTPTVTPTPTHTPTPAITPTPTVTPTPLSQEGDTDGDGLTDYEEVYLYSTNFINPDTDGDGLGDGAERDYWVARGENPLSPSYGDDDGTLNLLLDPDSDNDGVNDGTEVGNGTDPLNPDSEAPTIEITDPEEDQQFN